MIVGASVMAADGDANPAIHTMHDQRLDDVNVTLEVGRCFKASAPL